MLFMMLLVAAAAFAVAYVTYGRFLRRAFGLDDARTTPAVRNEDGEDYVPTGRPILLSQHFAAIAAVGPIAGPILAGTTYGWLPGLVWILIGAVFIGAVHDFATLVASVRHEARSIREVVSLYVGRVPGVVFSLFIWLSLVYVIVVFADLTASAFVDRPELGAENFGPGVATSSFLYLGLAVAMGVAMSRFRWPLWLTTVTFVPAIFVILWLGQQFPLVLPGDAVAQQRAWDLGILGYCFAASLIPLWLLLQPRGYLGGYILYATFAIGILGLMLGGQEANFPALRNAADGSPPALFPLLFTTIACGACSGFHGLVSSGTTSKQLRRESDAVTVGYGGMLLEGFVAVVAMGTLMLLAPGAQEFSHGPDEIYARGLAHFMEVFGIPFAAGVVFGKLAFATFIYDTLDVATRLGRYIVQELFGLTGWGGAIVATVLTLAMPTVALFVNFHDAAGKAVPLWKMFWPAFGASNQLLAALSLTAITIWLRASGRNFWITGVPAAFMVAVSLGSLTMIVRNPLADGRYLDPVGTTGLVLLVFAAIVLIAALRVLRRPPQLPASGSPHSRGVNGG